MLQSVLQNLIPAMQNAAMVVIPLAMLLALASKEEFGTLKKFIWRGIIWGVIGAAFITTAKLGSKAVKREVFESLVLVAGLTGEIVLLGLFLWIKARGDSFGKHKILGGVACLVAATLLLYHGLEFFLFPINLIISTSDLISLDFLMKGIGLFLGLFLTWLTGLTVFRAAKILIPQTIINLLTIQLLVVMAKQLVVVIQVMMARKLLMAKGLMSIMGPVINHEAWFLYSLLAVTLFLPIALFLQGKPSKPEGLNPAQYRKILVTVRKKMRWGIAVSLSVLVVFFCSSVGKGYADEKAEIVPAVPVVAEQGQIPISLEKVSDGHLHRFSYQSSTGEIVRFIIIKKSGSAYGVGLDACEICGPTGYFERDNQVVCALCDVVMNTATIGFKGGCNPIPVDYKVSEGKIMVEVAGLEKEKNRFK
ncbi:Fe-S-containing protein [Pelosinus sp. sgz500959]|uniref:Fe-S-containing protein n=1 Tax=Pelosinus sp. sgz500959 TaxID=3242472 RepID=UPI00366EF52F